MTVEEGSGGEFETFLYVHYGCLDHGSADVAAERQRMGELTNVEGALFTMGAELQPTRMLEVITGTGTDTFGGVLLTASVGAFCSTGERYRVSIAEYGWWVLI